MAERFYTNCSLQPGPVVLHGAEAHHLATVSRHRPGGQVCLFNGDGNEYPAHINAVERKSVMLEVEEVVNVNRELPFMLEIAAPVPKGDRGQFLVEKLTELGIARFTPLITERSVCSMGHAKKVKLERYVIEACKQCGRNVLMQIGHAMKWEEYCRREKEGKTKILAHPAADRSEGSLPSVSAAKRRQAAFVTALQSCNNGVVAAVGPEGGFTEREIALAEQIDWKIVNLGPRILRIETAAIVVASLVATYQTDA